MAANVVQDCTHGRNDCAIQLGHGALQGQYLRRLAGNFCPLPHKVRKIFELFEKRIAPQDSAVQQTVQIGASSEAGTLDPNVPDRMPNADLFSLAGRKTRSEDTLK
jgi:hypothetical protein